MSEDAIEKIFIISTRRFSELMEDSCNLIAVRGDFSRVPKCRTQSATIQLQPARHQDYQRFFLTYPRF